MVTIGYPPVTGSLSIAKQVGLGTDFTTVFTFTAGGGLSPTTFELTNMGIQTYSGLTPGSGYSIVEIVPDGWSVTYEVSNGSPIDNLLITGGETTFILVINTPIIPVDHSGIYKIQPNKRNDTLWTDVVAGTTEDVKIPNPKVRSALLGE
jgi:hypothetical protein